MLKDHGVTTTFVNSLLCPLFRQDTPVTIQGDLLMKTIKPVVGWWKPMLPSAALRVQRVVECQRYRFRGNSVYITLSLAVGCLPRLSINHHVRASRLRRYYYKHNTSIHKQSVL